MLIFMKYTGILFPLLQHLAYLEMFMIHRGGSIDLEKPITLIELAKIPILKKCIISLFRDSNLFICVFLKDCQDPTGVTAGRK